MHNVSGWNNGRTSSIIPSEGIINNNDEPTCLVGVTDLAEDILESSNISNISS